MDSNCVCEECTSPDLKWQETSIERTDAAGVSNSKQQSLNKARELDVHAADATPFEETKNARCRRFGTNRERRRQAHKVRRAAQIGLTGNRVKVGVPGQGEGG